MSNLRDRSNLIGSANIPADGTNTLHMLPDVFFPSICRFPPFYSVRSREKYVWLARLRAEMSGPTMPRLLL